MKLQKSRLTNLSYAAQMLSINPLQFVVFAIS